MKHATDDGASQQSDDPVAALLRLLRDEPHDDRRLRVEAEVRAAWDDAIGRRQRRQRVVWALAAALAVAALGAWLALRGTRAVSRPGTPEGAATFATIATVDGAVVRRSPSGVGTPLRTGDILRVGDRVETGVGRLGVTTRRGADLRLDAGTVLAVVADADLGLDAGALYYDNHAATDAEPIRVATRFGTATDIGTRFALRIDDDVLRLAVRDGTVEVARANGPLRAKGGQEVTVSDQGEIDRRALPSFDVSWSWIASVAPRFELDGASLAAFITWLEHESGWTVQFRNPGLAEQAATWTLSGPELTGLAFEDALALATRTNALAYELENGVVTIEGDDI